MEANTDSNTNIEDSSSKDEDGCNLDCSDFPNDCISENLFMSIADAMVSTGLRDAGYEYVSIDDCWMSKNRTDDGKLQPDPTRFPSGIKALAKYMHDRGLKLGIYEDFGTYTCMGYPGSEGHEEVDANTFAEWEVDMLKFDGCYSSDSQKEYGYINMGKYLNATGRPILYACSWPAYISNPNYTVIAEYCNQWRNQDDIQDSFDNSVLHIIQEYVQNQDEYAQFNGPGQFNDPDELIIGDGGLSIGQQRIQMSIWCMWSAPLLISSDLRSISNDSLQILLNRFLIGMDKDPLGDFAKQVYSNNNKQEQIFVKTLTPLNSSLSFTQGGREAVLLVPVNALAFVNVRTDDQTVLFKDTPESLGIPQPNDEDCVFGLFNVFTQEFLPKADKWDKYFEVKVLAMDVATFIVYLPDTCLP
ncbi:alpha-N-acetylgalactosaminidase-like [Convolutriloba macropyga]|uniref:alpha-N-acetylgalactosaminidase-like n=1 Tax=Convolutriloba macropyga TaxID=536237 RepID=UPI003F528A04